MRFRRPRVRRNLTAALFIRAPILAVYLLPLLLPPAATALHALDHRLQEAHRQHQAMMLGELYQPSMQAGAHTHNGGAPHVHETSGGHASAIEALLAAADALPGDETEAAPPAPWLVLHVPAAGVTLQAPPCSRPADLWAQCLPGSCPPAAPVLPPPRCHPGHQSES